MGQTSLPAQQSAIKDVRARYERGEIPFEMFRRALDALVLARNTDECEAILAELPAPGDSPTTALDAPIIAEPDPLAEPRATRIVAFMSQAKKVRRSWRLAPSTEAIAFMGEVTLDLNLAELPPQAHLRVTAVMGTIIIYAPRSASIAVRSTVLLSGVNALGEYTGGVVTFGHEEHTPPAPTAPQIEIEAFALMSNIKVVLTDGPMIPIGEIVRDALRAAAAGVRRGLRSGTRLDEHPAK
jgi:hypothetical protein